ncbi:hypothetical protein [Nannocystis pusilla]|uniref:UspA domain-containing protein n=1 Tax=Nannocystis pusilla TaxID=889268 RepID=A0ABS7TT25_9BACT|nr:hypothetical protein [Nannocystis pusilla]MBZ5711387.1 hypothetical protein [Nannocystis pusilla]
MADVAAPRDGRVTIVLVVVEFAGRRACVARLSWLRARDALETTGLDFVVAHVTEAADARRADVLAGARVEGRVLALVSERLPAAVPEWGAYAGGHRWRATPGPANDGSAAIEAFRGASVASRTESSERRLIGVPASDAGRGPRVGAFRPRSCNHHSRLDRELPRSPARLFSRGASPARAPCAQSSAAV